MVRVDFVKYLSLVWLYPLSRKSPFLVSNHIASKSPTKLVFLSVFSLYPKFPFIISLLFNSLPLRIASASTSVHPFCPVVRFVPRFQFWLSITCDNNLSCHLFGCACKAFDHLSVFFVNCRKFYVKTQIW